MMTKLAHIRENRKNNKGFSLVELIIVIAIMVALIAVMGPQYVKYVQSSRDAVVGDAAESLLSVVKSEFALNNLALKGTTTTDTIQIAAKAGNGEVVYKFGSNVMIGANAKDISYDFKAICGIDTSKTVKSDVLYTITIAKDNTNGGYTFTMAKAATGATDVTAEAGPAAYAA